MNTIKITLLKLFIVLIMLPISDVTAEKSDSHDSGTPRVTVWVHGTSGEALFPFKRTTKTIKRIERRACEAPLGLHNAGKIPSFYYQKFIAKTISDADPEEFPFEHFYIFGWSGALKRGARKAAGLHLYKEIDVLTQNYLKRYGKKPIITIISHSHGGNVVLESALQGREKNPDFCIDRAILLACPVQRKTAVGIDNGVIIKPYSLYSPKDYLQILDPQRIPYLIDFLKLAIRLKPLHELKNSLAHIKQTPLFSARRFSAIKEIPQVEIHWQKQAPWTEQDLLLYESYGGWVKKTVNSWPIKNGRALLHIEFIHHSFLSKLPHIIKAIDNDPSLTVVKI